MSRITLVSVLAGPLLAAAAGDVDAQTPFYVYEPRECGRLGVSFTQEEPVTIRAVMPGSPADRAGLQSGDVFVRIDGAKASLPAVLAFADDLEPGDTVRIHFRRGGADRSAALVAARDVCMRRVAHTDLRADVSPRLLALRLRDSTVVLRLDSIRSEWAERLAQLERRRQAERDSIRSRWADVFAQLEHRRMDRDTTLQRWLYEQRATRDSLLSSLRERQRVATRIRIAHPEPFGPPAIHTLSVGWRAVAGAEFSELNADLAQYFEGATEGLLVLRVAPRTPSARAGLRPGDVVIHAGGDPVHTIGDLRFIVATAEHRPVPIVVIRKGERTSLALPPER